MGVFAAGRHRKVAAHGTLHLREPQGAVSGRAADIQRELAARAALRKQFFARIAECTGRPLQVVQETWRAGRYLEPFDVVALGYADDVVWPSQVPRAGAARAPAIEWRDFPADGAARGASGPDGALMGDLDRLELAGRRETEDAAIEVELGLRGATNALGTPEAVLLSRVLDVRVGHTVLT